MKKRMLTALIINKNGVLTRLIGLCTKHQYKVESLALVVYSEIEEISKISVILEIDNDHKFLQFTKLVNKQIDVLFVTDVNNEAVIERELSLIKKLLL